MDLHEISVIKQVSAEAMATRTQIESIHKETLREIKINKLERDKQYTTVKYFILGIYLLIGLQVLISFLNYWKLNHG